MTSKTDLFPAINSNPVLSVAKDGVILYSNKAGKPLLHDWGVRIGEQLPQHLKIFVQRAFSRKSVEKIEVNMGKEAYFVVFNSLPEQECVNIYIFDIGEREKLEGELQESKTQEKMNLELARIIDTKAVQSLMSDFYTLAHIPIGIVDLKGNILVRVGWQDICTKFHRFSPEACKHCIESDLNLTAGVAPGGYKLYKCKNNMWDVVTPIIVEGQHVGNIFSGQFFFEDEPLDYELFRFQARKYGFNEEEYITALEKVPRLSREAVDTGMAFFMTFANMISQLSYSNIKMSLSLAERDSLVAALRESEKRFRSVLENSLDSAYRLDLQNKNFDYMSPVIEQITGFSAKELDAMSIDDRLDRIYPDDRKLFVLEIAQLSEGFGAHEYRFKCKDGKYRWLADHFSIIKDQSGIVRFRAGIVRDITERKKAEEALMSSNLYNRSLIEASLDPLVTIGYDGKITDVNDATEQVTGYSRGELIGTDFSDYFTEPEKARKGYQQVFMDGEVRDYHLEIKHKNGHITPVLYNASVYRDENGKIIGVFAAARDITAIKKAEEKIQTLANIVESSNDAVITESLDGIVTSWNKGAEQVYGYLAKEVLGKNISILEPDNTKGETKRLIEKIKQGQRVQHYETLRIKKDGTIVNVSITLSPVFDASGKLVAISAIARDITEKKKAEETIRLSNLYNRSLIEASLDPLVTIGRDGKITDVNSATEKVTGYSRNELIGTDFSDYFTYPEKARKGYQQVFMDCEVRDYHLEIKRKDGHITPVLYNASVYRDENGMVIGVFAAARDITERKRAEEALLESESRLRLAQISAGAGIWDWNISTGNLIWSDELFQLFGLDSRKTDASFDVWRNVLHPDDRLTAEKRIETAINNNTSLDSEYRIVLPSGEVRWINALGNMTYDGNGKPQRMSGICIDITERKKVEEALRESEERLRLLGDNLPDSAVYQCVYEPDGSVRFLYFSKGIERLTGIRVSDVLRDPKTLYRQVPPYYLERIAEAEPHSARELSDFDMEVPMRLSDGQLRWMRLRSRPCRLPDGQIIWNGVQTDITERKKAEEALKKAHENLEKIVEERTAELEKAYNSLKESEKGLAEAQKMAHIGNWEWDIATDKGYWSEEMYRIFERDPQELAPPYHEFLNYIHPDDRDYVGSALQKAVKGKINSIEYRIVLANGKVRSVHMQSEIVFDGKYTPVRTKGIIQDITERKEAEEALENIEIARKKEIHHRIKNNLQVISSLLDLQADKFDSPKVIEAFRESQDRVISMALIHEELYKGEGTDTLDFSEYLKELAENLFQTYSLTSKNIRLCMYLEANAFLNMDTAVPLGIIVNELVSNSLKHAFQGRDEGEIQIKLCREEGECKREGSKSTVYTLTVLDNGVGIPENLDIEDLDSLGIQLITTLVDQLDGELELKRNNGTEFTLRFTVIEKDNLAQVDLK